MDRQNMAHPALVFAEEKPTQQGPRGHFGHNTDLGPGDTHTKNPGHKDRGFVSRSADISAP